MLLDLYSKRRRRELGQIDDVYSFDKIPTSLRVQIVHIIRDALEPAGGPDEKAEAAYKFLHDALAREYGLFELTKSAEYGNFAKALLDFFLNTGYVQKALDVIELSFRYALLVVPEWHYASNRRASAEAAVNELNARLKEAAVGYQFEGEEIVRVDSELLHESAFKPALRLLQDARFEGANEEFLLAHEHYRHGRHKEALNEALKSFESTMKTICDGRKWAYPPTATASKLLDVCFANDLLPALFQAHFTGIRTTLEAGVPTVRNKLSGHGQGSTAVGVPEHIVTYALNVTAAGIRLLVEADSA